MPNLSANTPITVYLLRTKFIVAIEAVVTDFQLALDWERSNPKYRYYIKHIVDNPEVTKIVKRFIYANK